MTQTVSIGINAQPTQVIEAFRKITEEAKRLGIEVKNMSSLDMIPGLEDAKQQIRDINAGMQQMYSTAVRGSAASALRSGRQAGLYNDAMSWHQNVGRQFPDAAAQQRHVDAVLMQAQHISSMGGGGGGGISPGGISPGGMRGYAGPGMGAAVGGLMHGNIGGVLGGAAGGSLGLMSANPIVGMIGAAVGSAIGSKFDAAIGKFADQSMQESYGMTDFRRSVYGINEDFTSFRKNVRAAGDGLGVTFNETLALSRSFAQLSGVTGSAGVAGGTRAAILMSRQFGLDPSQGASMMGRASFLGLGGGDIKRQARMLAEAMAGSNLGARQADAADAMLRFAEKSAGHVGDGGDVAGYTGRLLALFNSGNMGIRANAANILSGYDDSVRAGGRAGDAGKNFIYNAMAANGTADPFDVEMALEGGFTGKMENGKMIGPELLRRIQSQYGGMGKNAMASATKGLFGGSATIAKEIIDILAANPNMSDEAAGKKVDALMADLNKGDPGTDLRVASANLNNAAQELIGDRMLPILTKMNTVLADLTNAINSWLGKPSKDGVSLKPGLGGTPRIDPAAAVNYAVPVKGSFPSNSRFNTVKSMFDDPEFMARMDAESKKYGMDPAVARAVMKHESRGYSNARNGDAVGLFQMTKRASKDVGLSLEDRQNPDKNMQGGIKYLAQMAKENGGDLYKTLASYNNGSANIKKGNYVIPLKNGGTQDADAYARKVMFEIDVIHKNERGVVLYREKKDAKMKYPSNKPH